MSREEDSFFSRWSRRKVQVRTGQPLPPEPVLAPLQAPAVAVPVARSEPAAPAPATADDVPAQPTEEAPPLPTLDDVARLTPASDFSTFVARGVPADVRNAAVKKLFTDPHFNVMDGLDIYIDDYSKPSPLSVADMAKMVGAQFLKLVDDPNEPKPAAAVPPPASLPGTDPDSLGTEPAPAEQRAAADPEPATEAGQSDPTAPPQTHDDHADLQLQPDDAPGPQGPGHRTG
jgi:hypothetical protein